jgi:hypothetical protein
MCPAAVHRPGLVALTAVIRPLTEVAPAVTVTLRAIRSREAEWERRGMADIGSSLRSEIGGAMRLDTSPVNDPCALMAPDGRPGHSARGWPACPNGRTRPDRVARDR